MSGPEVLRPGAGGLPVIAGTFTGISMPRSEPPPDDKASSGGCIRFSATNGSARPTRERESVREGGATESASVYGIVIPPEAPSFERANYMKAFL